MRVKTLWYCRRECSQLWHREEEHQPLLVLELVCLRHEVGFRCVIVTFRVYELVQCHHHLSLVLCAIRPNTPNDTPSTIL